MAYKPSNARGWDANPFAVSSEERVCKARRARTMRAFFDVGESGRALPAVSPPRHDVIDLPTMKTPDIFDMLYEGSGEEKTGDVLAKASAQDVALTLLLLANWSRSTPAQMELVATQHKVHNYAFDSAQNVWLGVGAGQPLSVYCTTRLKSVNGAGGTIVVYSGAGEVVRQLKPDTDTDKLQSAMLRAKRAEDDRIPHSHVLGAELFFTILVWERWDLLRWLVSYLQRYQPRSMYPRLPNDYGVTISYLLKPVMGLFVASPRDGLCMEVAQVMHDIKYILVHQQNKYDPQHTASWDSSLGSYVQLL